MGLGGEGNVEGFVDGEKSKACPEDTQLAFRCRGRRAMAGSYAAAGDFDVRAWAATKRKAWWPSRAEDAYASTGPDRQPPWSSRHPAVGDVLRYGWSTSSQAALPVLSPGDFGLSGERMARICSRGVVAGSKFAGCAADDFRMRRRLVGAAGGLGRFKGRSKGLLMGRRGNSQALGTQCDALPARVSRDGCS